MNRGGRASSQSSTEDDASNLKANAGNVDDPDVAELDSDHLEVNNEIDAREQHRISKSVRYCFFQLSFLEITHLFSCVAAASRLLLIQLETLGGGILLLVTVSYMHYAR